MAEHACVAVDIAAGWVGGPERAGGEAGGGVVVVPPLAGGWWGEEVVGEVCDGGGETAG